MSEQEISARKQRARAWFESLRDRICAAFEAIEDELTDGPFAHLPPGRFERKAWERSEANGGGGVMGLMRGRVFEKVGVNVSTVEGQLEPAFAKQFEGVGEDRRFWASGISLVAHMRSPKIPAVHMNTRHFSAAKSWFGGGADLNPMVEVPQDTQDFHARLKVACDAHNPDYFPRYKKWCDEYFFIPHRGEARGVGGIFYDHLDAVGDAFEPGFAFTRDVGEAFLDIYPQIVRRHLHETWTDDDRLHQLFRRGRYAEFNLVYDRGTTFGLKTGGNVEAILMSLPPEAAWP
jgi:coproporphyrinogen III oxidase